MRTRLAALLVFTVTGLAGCDSVLPEACQSRPVRDEAGQDYRCVVSEDCPRSANVTLCVRDVPGEVECIRCLDTRCVRVPPETCS